jgi:hypothetical protein
MKGFDVMMSLSVFVSRPGRDTGFGVDFSTFHEKGIFYQK